VCDRRIAGEFTAIVTMGLDTLSEVSTLEMIEALNRLRRRRLIWYR
jgi:hypothetical protein